MKKILFYTNIPSPYRMDFFNELGKCCELTVIFEIKESKERDSVWKDYKFKNFKGIIMKGVRTHTDRAFCPAVVRYLNKEKYDYIVVTVMASLTALLAVTFLKMKKIPYCYEGDGAILKMTGTKGIKAAIKKYIIGGADKCFSTSAQFDNYCEFFGADRKKIIRYPFSSILGKDISDKPADAEEKIRLRKELGLDSEKKVLIGVGRIVSIKGWDILLRAAEALKDDWCIYIVGGSITEELKVYADRLSCSVNFVDFVPKKRLFMYYRAADIFVLPTLYDPWGLVVNEAMAAGLPVITTDMCVAGLELVKEGKNGYIYESQSVDGLKGLLTLLSEMDADKLSAMGEKAIETAKGYTIENMVKAHMKIFEE